MSGMRKNMPISLIETVALAIELIKRAEIAEAKIRELEKQLQQAKGGKDDGPSNVAT